MKKIITILILIFLSCNDSKTQPTIEKDNINVDNFNKGNQELQSHNFTKAIEYYNEVINSTPIDAYSLIVTESYIYRAVAKGELGDNRGAISDFSTVINNTNITDLKAQGFHMRGLAYLKMGDYNSACSDWSKSGELGINQSYDLIKENCN